MFDIIPYTDADQRDKALYDRYPNDFPATNATADIRIVLSGSLFGEASIITTDSPFGMSLLWMTILNGKMTEVVLPISSVVKIHYSVTVVKQIFHEQYMDIKNNIWLSDDEKMVQWQKESFKVIKFNECGRDTKHYFSNEDWD